MTGASTNAAKAGSRLASLDALRGFDMFWIIGGDTLVHLIALGTGWALLGGLSDQLRHAPWQGFRAYDLIFPLFMFLSGVSLALSLARRQEQGLDNGRFLRRTAVRAAILVGLGVIYNFGWALDPARFRLASVLGQIGLAYVATAAVFIMLRSWQGRALAALSICGIVALLQLLLPVPGIGPGVLTAAGSVNGWIDRMLLPGRLHGGVYDPEGLLCVFSSISVTMLGGLAGRLIRQGGAAPTRLGLIGAALIVTGVLLSPVYPIIKALWTVPFNLVAGGASMLLLGLCHDLIDRRGGGRWAFFFIVIGANAIGIYMAARFFAYPLFAMLADSASVPPLLGALLVALIVLVEWLALRWCYRRGWFFKV